MKKSKSIILIAALAVTLCMSGCGSATDSYNSSTTTAGAIYDSVGSSNYNDSFSIQSESTVKNNLKGNIVPSDTDEYYDSETTEYEYEDTDVQDQPVSGSSTTSENVYDTKLIYRTNVEIETLDFDNDYTSLKELIKKYNGFIEQENFSNSGSSYLSTYRYEDRAVVKRNVEILIRIPTENFDAFNNENEARGNLINKTSNVENITQNYYDTTAQVKSLEVQLARLQEMMESAVDYTDMIELNREITDIEYQLNKMKTVVRTMDMDVAYSYVAINLKEVVEYSEIEEVKKDTFFNRLKETIDDSIDSFSGVLEDILFAVIMLLPYLVIITVVIVVIRIVFRKRFAENKKLRKLERQALLNIITNKDSSKKSDVVNNVEETEIKETSDKEEDSVENK